MPIKRHNAYAKLFYTTVVGEGSGLAICACMRPRGDPTPILADESLPSAFPVLVVMSSSASDTEAMSLCGSHVIMLLSDKSKTARHDILIFDMYSRGQKYLDISITNSRPRDP